jgi:hypothetical protein
LFMVIFLIYRLILHFGHVNKVTLHTANNERDEQKGY